MHSRMEMYASRLAEVELSRTRSNSTPDSDDEHQLIAHYCHSLNGGDPTNNLPRSPVQVIFFFFFCNIYSLVTGEGELLH